MTEAGSRSGNSRYAFYDLFQEPIGWGLLGRKWAVRIGSLDSRDCFGIGGSFYHVDVMPPHGFFPTKWNYGFLLFIFGGHARFLGYGY